MADTTTTPGTGIIPAIEPGKYKSVACAYAAGPVAADLTSLPTDREHLRKLFAKHRPAAAVIEACRPAGSTTCATDRASAATSPTPPARPGTGPAPATARATPSPPACPGSSGRWRCPCGLALDPRDRDARLVGAPPAGFYSPQAWPAESTGGNLLLLPRQPGPTEAEGGSRASPPGAEGARARGLQPGRL
jgi:hypothetical protein